MTDQIVGQVIALTRNILLRSPDGTRNGMEQFFVGKRDAFSFTGGIGLSWWYTQQSSKALENISFLITSQVGEFSECDYKTIQNVVRETLHEICVDKNIFNGDLVCFGQKDNLFECKVETNTKNFGLYILNAVFENIRNTISSCLVLYTAPRITGNSFSIDSHKLHVINKNDGEKWAQLANSGYCIDEWDPAAGNFKNGRATAFSSSKYDYVFLAETKGTNEGNKLSASLKFRKLFSVIMAVIEYRYKFKVAARPCSVCLQVPHLNNKKRSFVQNEIGELCPYYGNETVLTDNNILDIQRWYAAEQALALEQKNRTEKCSHFINKGMNGSDIEVFINYFVALDALYGKSGSVFTSIEEGVNNLPASNQWSEKISWLFDLRNELVHGGSRYIEEWPKYIRYYRHFKSDPARDMEKLAFHALASAPFSWP